MYRIHWRDVPARSVVPGAVLTLSLLLTACGMSGTSSDVAEPAITTASAPATDVRPESLPTTGQLLDPTPTAPAAATKARGPAVPADLVGSWVSTDNGNAEMIYEFDADGTYRYAGVLIQKRPSGTFSFEVGAAGTIRTTRTRITLRPERGTQTLKDPDSATGGWQRPVSKAVQVVRWRMDGDRLVLTSGDGIAVDYRRQ
jgi:hypothetical protein